MRNPLKIRGTEDRVYIIYWSQDWMDYVYIHVAVDTKKFGFETREVLYTHKTRETPTSFLNMSSEQVKMEYVNAAQEYERIINNQRKLRATEVKAKPTWNTIRSRILMGLGCLAFGVGVTMCTNHVQEREALRPKFVRVELDRYVLVHIDPPKHMYVTLKNVGTGAVSERLHVGKHCNAWRNNTIGAEYNIAMQVMYDPVTKREYEVFPSLSGVFC